MADAGKDDERGIGNAAHKILGVFAPDELIALALHDRDRQTERGEIGGAPGGLGALHGRHRIGEVLERVGRHRQRLVVGGVPAEAAAEQRIGFVDLLHSAGIHVAGEEEHAG